MMQNIKRDRQAIASMLRVHNELAEALVEYKAKSISEFASLNPIIQRGMIHAVGDMYELMGRLSKPTKEKVGLNSTYLKEFRNILVHNYGSLKPQQAYSWVSSCASKEVKKNLQSISDELKIAAEKPIHEQ